MPTWPPPPPTPTHILGRRPVARKPPVPQPNRPHQTPGPDHRGPDHIGDEYRLPGIVHYTWIAGIVLTVGLIALPILT